MHITTRHDVHPTGTPTVRVENVYPTGAEARAANRNGGVNVLPVWEMAGRRAPKPGDTVGTYRDGRTLYVIGPAA